MSNIQKHLNELKEKPSKSDNVSLLNPSLRHQSKERQTTNTNKNVRCISGTTVPADRRILQTSGARPIEGDRLLGVLDDRKMEYVQHIMSSRSSQNEESSGSSQTEIVESKTAYEHALADAFGTMVLPQSNGSSSADETKSTMILSFRSQAAPLAHQTSRHRSANHPPVSATNSGAHSRYISLVPERVLDAPNVRNDFYLNLLSWSDTNVLAVALENSVYLWNATTGSIAHLMDCDDMEEVTCVRCCPGSTGAGSVIALGLSSGSVQLWDMEQKQLLRSMPLSSPSSELRVPAIAWKEHMLWTGSRSGYLHGHDVRIANHEVRVLMAHSQEICGLEWSPNGTYLASGGNDNICNIWSANGLMGGSNSNSSRDLPAFTIVEHTAAVKALGWCPWRDNLLATGAGSIDAHLRLFNVTMSSSSANSTEHSVSSPESSIRQLRSIASVNTNSQVGGILWNEDYRELITGHGSPDNQLSMWSYPKLHKVKDLAGHTGRVLCMAQSPDRESIASLSADETIRIWRCFKLDEATKKKKEDTEREEKNRHVGRGIFATLR